MNFLNKSFIFVLGIICTMSPIMATIHPEPTPQETTSESQVITSSEHDETAKKIAAAFVLLGLLAYLATEGSSKSTPAQTAHENVESDTQSVDIN